MAGTGSGGAIPGVVLGTIDQVNGLLGAGLTILATYKAAREAWKAAHPSQESPFLEDSQLIELLRQDAAALVAHVDQVLAKHPGAPAADTAGDSAGGV